ncbi:hypothetical protein ACU4GH_04490 [Bradyrhizobium betae]
MIGVVIIRAAHGPTIDAAIDKDCSPPSQDDIETVRATALRHHPPMRAVTNEPGVQPAADESEMRAWADISQRIPDQIVKSLIRSTTGYSCFMLAG